MNVARALEEAARRWPEVPAILFEDREITYRELDRQVNRAAHLLAEGNGHVRPGDRVALFLPNIPEFAVAYLAIQKLGAVAVSVNVMSKAPEVRYLLEDCGAVALFTTAALMAEVAPVRDQLPRLCRVVSCEGGERDLAAASSGYSDRFTALPRAGLDPAAILYTSGTTGKPKGAVLTQGNLVSNVAATVGCVGAQPGDRHIAYLPLFHCFGQNFILNACIRSGGTLVLERRFDLQATLADVARHRVTHFYGVPTIFIQLRNAGVPPEALASVRYFFSAAATMPREVASDWLARFGRPIHEGYGLTETSPFACYNHGREYRLGSVGTPIEGVEMKIVDEAGRPQGPGQWGEICIKGPNVMAGYFGRETETLQVLAEGWFHSGDIGYRDADGYYYLVDRKKDMINCAGFKVWPREVEEVLHQHPDVEECAVVGVHHPIRGETVRAFVKLRGGRAGDGDGLRAHCEAHLARYKVPDEFVFDRNIPRNPSGKILKRVLKEAS